MPEDLIERLRRENPVPGDLPARPVEPLLRRLDEEPPPAGMRSYRRAGSVLPVAVSVLIVVAISAGAFLALHGSGPAAAPQPTSHPARPAWLAGLTTRFSVLRNAPTLPPPRLRESIEHLGSLAFARRVALTTGTVWIVPSPTRLCLAVVRPGDRRALGTSCASDAQAQRTGVSLTVAIHAEDATWVAGVVPDGVTGVQIHHTSGAIITALVSDNAYLTTVTPRVTRTHWIRRQPPYPTNASGQTYGTAGQGTRRRQEPDLIAATGKRLHGAGHVQGYILASQANAVSCGDVKTPNAAVDCTKRNHGRTHTIPIYAQNGTTIIGTFTIG